MLRFTILCVMAAMCAAQLKSQYAGLGSSVQYLPSLPVDVASPIKSQYAGLSSTGSLGFGPAAAIVPANQYNGLSYAGAPVAALAPAGALQFQQSGSLLPSYPVEVAPQTAAVAVENWGSETINFPAPATGLDAPLINLPKGSQEIVDIPNAAIAMPGNAIQNKDLLLNLPSPTIEAPNPIIRNKDVLFRLPQPIFYVPNPVVQHKPIVHRVPHTLRTITPRVNLQATLFKVPSAQITGKSGY